MRECRCCLRLYLLQSKEPYPLPRFRARRAVEVKATLILCAASDGISHHVSPTFSRIVRGTSSASCSASSMDIATALSLTVNTMSGASKGLSGVVIATEMTAPCSPSPTSNAPLRVQRLFARASPSLTALSYKAFPDMTILVSTSRKTATAPVIPPEIVIRTDHVVVSLSAGHVREARTARVIG